MVLAPEKKSGAQHQVLTKDLEGVGDGSLTIYSTRIATLFGIMGMEVADVRITKQPSYGTFYFCAFDYISIQHPASSIMPCWL